MDAAGLLKLARSKAGLSLRELAGRAETSHSTLAAYEQGRVTPTMATADRIVRAAGFDLELRLVPAIDDKRRGQELWDALLLAEMFPARHRGDLTFPVFPGR
jgi:transcriptional regulator with XRE-family HTH domain